MRPYLLRLKFRATPNRLHRDGVLRLIAPCRSPPFKVNDAFKAREVIARCMRGATDKAIDLVVFPEAFLLGHSYDRDTMRLRAQEAVRGSVLSLSLYANPVGTRASLQRLTFPAQLHRSTTHHAINGRMDNRHRRAPVLTPVFYCPHSSHLARAESCAGRAVSEQRRNHGTGLFYIEIAHNPISSSADASSGSMLSVCFGVRRFSAVRIRC